MHQDDGCSLAIMLSEKDFRSQIWRPPMDDPNRMIDENLVWAHSIAGAYAASIRHVDVKDIKQEASVALCRAADTYDPSRNVPFRAYAHRCITNRLDSLYRAGQKQAQEETTLDTTFFLDDVNDETFKDQIPAVEVDAAREAHRNEVRRALAEGMNKLTPNQREILEARSRGESFREIADRLGVTKQAVKSTADRALAQMKSSVEAAGVRGAMFMPSIDSSDKATTKPTGCTAVLLLVPVSAAIVWIIGEVLL
jgi:RNA polymerase sigma factor (sigma-70 family)